jgi:hypothetical protein
MQISGLSTNVTPAEKLSIEKSEDILDTEVGLKS